MLALAAVSCVCEARAAAAQTASAAAKECFERALQRQLDRAASILNDWPRRYAARHGHVYLDYYTATADAKGFLKDERSEDGLHPNVKGYAAMAPLAEKAVAAALARRLSGARAAPGSRPGSVRPAGSAP